MAHVPIDVTFRHGSPTEWVRELIQEQADKLYQHSDIVHRVEAVLDMPQNSSRKGQQHEVHLVLHLDGLKEMAITEASKERDTDNVRADILEAFATAERRLRRVTERRREQRRRAKPGKE